MGGKGGIAGTFDGEVTDDHQNQQEKLDIPVDLQRTIGFFQNINPERDIQAHARHAELGQRGVVGIGNVVVESAADAPYVFDAVLHVNIGIIYAGREGGETGESRSEGKIIPENGKRSKVEYRTGDEVFFFAVGEALDEIELDFLPGYQGHDGTEEQQKEDVFRIELDPLHFIEIENNGGGQDEKAVKFGAAGKETDREHDDEHDFIAHPEIGGIEVAEGNGYDCGGKIGFVPHRSPEHAGKGEVGDADDEQQSPKEPGDDA